MTIPAGTFQYLGPMLPAQNSDYKQVEHVLKRDEIMGYIAFNIAVTAY